MNPNQTSRVTPPSFRPIKVLDVELSVPLRPVEGLNPYAALQALIRLHGAPIGYVKIPLARGCCSAADLRKAILEEHSGSILKHLLADWLAASHPERPTLQDLMKVSHPGEGAPALPLMTVAVCTRDRADDLNFCLNALLQLQYPHLDILVVDNAPASDAAERLVRIKYPLIRYVREPRPGLNWARNRAIAEARGEIIAYTDDDVVVDPGWAGALARIFVESPETMAVTGLVAPYELETEAQLLFERRGGFGRGFERRWFQVEDPQRRPVTGIVGGAGKFGTGANMSYRLSVFERIGFFDPALDVGTPTEGGGDLEMFFRVLKGGYRLVYEPGAIVRHRHRRDYADLRHQLFTWGSGFNSYLLRSAFAYPAERLAIFRLWARWFFQHYIRYGLLPSLLQPPGPEKDLLRAELGGALLTPFRYLKSRSEVAKIVQTFDPLTALAAPEPAGLPRPFIKAQKGTAVRSVDLGQPVSALTDVEEYAQVRLFVSWGHRILGSVEISTYGQSIGTARLIDVIVGHFGLKLLDLDPKSSPDFLRGQAYAALARDFLPAPAEVKGSAPARLPSDVSVSVVVATYDRPNDLFTCLSSLSGQDSSRPLEIVVVDNHPASGLTPPVVREFPNVVLVEEPRQGLSYARNAGIVASQGEIVLSTDDDVFLPPDWVERLVAPFVRSDVGVVTGNILPLELETRAQQLFELYGGLSRGFERREVGREWFDSFHRHAVPTWTLGATANAAFRGSIFRDSRIGLLDEALGPGTPTGVGEDTYLFYRVLKSGYVIIYEPAACVWHRHRRDFSSFRRQIFHYSRGHVAYHLNTLIRDRDWRAFPHLLAVLPRWHMQRIKERLRGRSAYPCSLILLEMVGHLMGPFALWKSRRRVKREGRSKACLPMTISPCTHRELFPKLEASPATRSGLNDD